MKNRAAIVIVALSLVGSFAAGPARAQRPQLGNGVARGGARGGFSSSLRVLSLPPSVQAQLKLTEEQKTKIQGVSAKYQPELQEAVKGAQTSADRAAAMKKIRELMTKAESDAQAVLTPEQKKKFDAMQVEAQSYSTLGRAGMALLSVTGVTEEQKGKFKTIGMDAQAKRQAMIQTLVKTPTEEKRAAFDKLRGMETETTSKIRAALTPDQQKQFDAALNARPTLPAPKK